MKKSSLTKLKKNCVYTLRLSHIDIIIACSVNLNGDRFEIVLLNQALVVSYLKTFSMECFI